MDDQNPGFNLLQYCVIAVNASHVATLLRMGNYLQSSQNLHINGITAVNYALYQLPQQLYGKSKVKKHSKLKSILHT